MNTVLLAANGLVSAASGAFCVAAAIRPETLLRAQDGQATEGARFYARFYALRQLPLSVALVVALAIGDRQALPFLLTVAGAAQAGDSVLGGTRRDPGMMLGGAVAAVLHLGSAWWWLR